MTPAEQRFLIFTLQGVSYALDLHAVAEVKEPPAIFPIPRAPAYFIGVMNSHGSLVPVLDLALYTQTGAFVPNGKVLVLDNRIATLALWVDGIKTIAPAEMLTDERPGADELTEKILLAGDDEIKLLALETLLKKLEVSLTDKPLSDAQRQLRR
jgi:purine-binding chemotaxis protein CheW